MCTEWNIESLTSINQ